MPPDLRSKRAIPRRSGYTWALPEDLHLCCLATLSLEDLARVATVSTLWARLIASEGLWLQLCHRLWAGKHVSDACRAVAERSPRLAVRRSLSEANVCTIDRAELCSLSWSFRFKRQAGKEWTANDPWWLGAPARTLRFDPDGTVRWSDESWDGMMGWRLEGGSILRVRHAEYGAFPGELLMRCPSNWGFVFNSPWVVYTSFPMERVTDDKSLSDRSLARQTARWQWAEAQQYNEDGSVGSADDDDLPAFPVLDSD